MAGIRDTVTGLSVRERAEVLARLRHRDRPTPRGLDSAPATFQQRALWFLDRMSATSAYHMPVHLRLSGALDVAALQRAFAALVRRHDALRTRLVERDGQPWLEVLAAVPDGLRVVDVPAAETAIRAAAELGTLPIDLTAAPLWRARLWRIGPNDHLYTFAAHHVVLDGVSLAILWRDLSEHYQAEVDGADPRPAPPITYADYAAWQHERAAGGAWGRSLDHWLANLQDLPTLALPTDRPRPVTPTTAGGVRTAPVPPGVAAAVLDLARATGTTPFTVHLAAFWAFLAARSGHDDIVVGTATEGRAVAEVRDVVGYFAGMVVLRGDLTGSPTFHDLVARAASTTRQALAHADLPWELLVRAVAPDRDLRRSPLFQVSFAVTEPPATAPLGDVRAEPIHQDTGTARFDLAWTVTTGEAGEIVVEYGADLYDPGTVDSMIRSYVDTLRAALSDPRTPLGFSTRARPAAADDDPVDAYVAPVGPTEQALAAEFERVLGTTGLGAQTSFFRLGGSLQAAHAISLIRQRFGVEITVPEFFRTPTIADLAVRIDRWLAGLLDDDALLDLVESLPDDAVERLLADVA